MAKKQQSPNDMETPEQNTTSKIDAIKNLIFGENMVAYDTEFKLLKEDLLDKKKALEELIEETHTELRAAIDNVATDVNIRITALEDNLNNKIDDLDTAKVDKETLGKALISLGESISKR